MLRPLLASLAACAGLVAGLYAYRRRYDARHGLLAQNDREQVFQPRDWTGLASTPHPWLQAAHFDQQMTDWVQPYLAKWAQPGAVAAEDGTRLAYCYYPQAGQPTAPTLVVIHGLNEFKEKFHELIYYWHQEGCQILTLDLRGHGDSTPTGPRQAIHSQRFDCFADDVIRVLTQLMADGTMAGPVCLFGHSMGGAVATRVSQLRPDLVRGLILSSPMLAIDTGKVPFAYAQLLSRLMVALGRGTDYAPRQGAFEPERHAVYPRTNRLAHVYERGAYFHQWHLSHHQPPTWGATWAWLATSLASSRQILAPEALAQLTMPVMVWRAAEDTHVLASGLHGLAARLPQAQAYLVEGVKHELYLEHDDLVQAYATCIRHFIQTISHEGSTL